MEYTAEDARMEHARCASGWMQVKACGWKRSQRFASAEEGERFGPRMSSRVPGGVAMNRATKTAPPLPALAESLRSFPPQALHLHQPDAQRAFSILAVLPVYPSAKWFHRRQPDRDTQKRFASST